MTHLRRVLVVLLIALVMALSAVPASANPGKGASDRTPAIDHAANVTWE